MYEILEKLKETIPYENLNYDCSEIAEDVVNILKGKGINSEIAEFKIKNGTIKVKEFDVIKEFNYHQCVLVNNKIIDIRSKNIYLPLEQYLNELKEINESEVSWEVL